MGGLRIDYKDPRTLKPRVRNPRTHSQKQLRQIVASIEQFGFVSPVLVDAKDGIIAGHGRVAAAMLLGMTDIPTVRVDHLTPAQIRAYVIADNKPDGGPGAKWQRRTGRRTFTTALQSGNGALLHRCIVFAQHVGFFTALARQAGVRQEH